LFEYRSACAAEIGHVLSQAVFDAGGVGKVANAEAKGVGSTRRSLLGRTAVLLRRGGCRTKQHCQCLDRKSEFRNHVGYSSGYLWKNVDFQRLAASQKADGVARALLLDSDRFKLYGL